MAAGNAFPSRNDFYVDLLMQEWWLDEQSEEFQARVLLGDQGQSGG